MVARLVEVLLEDGCVGGICGTSNSGGKIESCVNDGNISGIQRVGGICGNSRGDINSCLNSGKISRLESDINDGIGAGGISGLNCGLISDSVNRGEVNDNYDVIGCGGICCMLGDFIGGFGKIENCLNDKGIKGKMAGGICAELIHGRIVNACNLGEISGNSVGPVFGIREENKYDDNEVKNSFFLEGCCDNSMENMVEGWEMLSFTDGNKENIVESLGDHFKMNDDRISMFWE